MAKENIAQAGFGDKCQIIVGPADETMTNLHPDIPFDMVFIDADKKSYPKYFREAKRLVKKGGVIVSWNFSFPSLVFFLMQMKSVFEKINPCDIDFQRVDCRQCNTLWECSRQKRQRREYRWHQEAFGRLEGR